MSAPESLTASSVASIGSPPGLIVLGETRQTDPQRSEETLTLGERLASALKDRASFTRFILPFSYQLDLEMNKSDHSAYFVEASEDSWLLENQRERRRYLTEETEDVLFDRARWWILEGKLGPFDWGCGKLGNGGVRLDILVNRQRCQVLVQAPALVLFEWADERPSNDATSTLKSGCLIFDLRLMDKSLVEPTTGKTRDDYHPPTLDHLLALNEKFRYFANPYPSHLTDELGAEAKPNSYASVLGDFPADWNTGEKISQCALSKSNVTEGEVSAKCYFERWASLLELPIKTRAGDFVHLMPNRHQADARSWIAEKQNERRGWICYSDNRAFVWTCAVVPQEDCERLVPDQPKHPSVQEGKEALKKNLFGYWVSLLNVDSPDDSFEKTNAASDFEREWADERTYRRWESKGTLYGFNAHSGAMIQTFPNGFTHASRHFGQMYFDQILLLLYLRVTLFRFSVRLNLLTTDALKKDDSKSRRQWRERFKELRWRFALFTNLYQFPLLSNQQQAIEMYAKARKYLDVDDLFKEIEAEVKASHEFLEVEENARISEFGARLNTVAAIGLILGLGLSLFAIDRLYGIWSNESKPSPTPNYIVTLDGRADITGSSTTSLTGALPLLVSSTSAVMVSTSLPSMGTNVFLIGSGSNHLVLSVSIAGSATNQPGIHPVTNATKFPQRLWQSGQVGFLFWVLLPVLIVILGVVFFSRCLSDGFDWLAHRPGPLGKLWTRAIEFLQKHRRP